YQPWTPEEDELLVRLVHEHPDRWAAIAAHLPGRSNKACRKRYLRSLDPSIHKGPWTQEEDGQLREAYAKHGCQWCKVAQCVPGRTDDQCAKRWREGINPSISRSHWTAQEDEALVQAVLTHGTKWSHIADILGGGRVGLQCRYRWRFLQ
ncbi:MAG: Homeodomain-like protein, partial [Piptocephalis tieghemiana]